MLLRSLGFPMSRTRLHFHLPASSRVLGAVFFLWLTTIHAVYADDSDDAAELLKVAFPCVEMVPSNNDTGYTDRTLSFAGDRRVLLIQFRDKQFIHRGLSIDLAARQIEANETYAAKYADIGDVKITPERGIILTCSRGLGCISFADTGGEICDIRARDSARICQPEKRAQPQSFSSLELTPRRACDFSALKIAMDVWMPLSKEAEERDRSPLYNLLVRPAWGLAQTVTRVHDDPLSVSGAIPAANSGFRLVGSCGSSCRIDWGGVDAWIDANRIVQIR